MNDQHQGAGITGAYRRIAEIVAEIERGVKKNHAGAANGRRRKSRETNERTANALPAQAAGLTAATRIESRSRKAENHEQAISLAESGSKTKPDISF